MKKQLFVNSAFAGSKQRQWDTERTQISKPCWVSPTVGSRVRHYWQNGGTVTSPLSSFRRHGSRDEGVRPCNSDLSFPLLGWVDRKGKQWFMEIINLGEGELNMSNLWPNLKLGINRQSIENWEAVSLADTVHLFRLVPWLVELDSGIPPYLVHIFSQCLL